MRNYFVFKVILILLLIPHYLGNASIFRLALEETSHLLSPKYLQTSSQTFYKKHLSFSRGGLKKYNLLKSTKSKQPFITKRFFCMLSPLMSEKNNFENLSSKGIIHIAIQNQLTPEMDQLRLLCFPPSSPQLTSRDEFDVRSKHIAIYFDNIIAAYGRLTPSPNSVFETWSQGQAQIPMGEDVIDLGRCCVDPLYRGSLLYEAIILKGFQYAKENHYKCVVGAYGLGRYVGTRLQKLGLEPSGNPVYLYPPYRDPTLEQPIVFKIKEIHYDWEQRIKEYLIDSGSKTFGTSSFMEVNTLGTIFKMVSEDIAQTSTLSSKKSYSGRLKNKIALITGAANGIGKATAQLFSSEGAQVILTDINDIEGLEVARKIGSQALYLHLDVRQEDEWKRVMSEVFNYYGKLDILVNNAGIPGINQNLGPQNPEECSLESWHKIHAINLDSVFLGCKHAIPLMKSTGKASIVNISSRCGLVGMPGAAAYASSKAAVRNHTKTVALYCAQNNYGIRCNSVHPAAIYTGAWDIMLRNKTDLRKELQKIAEQIPLGRMGTLDEVAYGILYLASDESSFVTGSELTIDGGILAGSSANPHQK